MTKEGTLTKDRITSAAREEFMEYGFIDASMRRIAAKSGITVSALYKHFKDKEEIFASLVEPAFKELEQAYLASVSEEESKIDPSYMDTRWEYGSDATFVIRFIYSHLDAFKLIVCRSKGTRFEGYADYLTELELRTSEQFLGKLSEATGISLLSAAEYRLFTVNTINAVFLPVRYGMTEEEALEYAAHLDTFCLAGWKALFT
ncbi:MAG: TetR/AcrR family transcriptional regulator [Saccharofermentans sp.]|nr:TetR/AcrR family transcriptional regulator [Saccharofermentans sp.]